MKYKDLSMEIIGICVKIIQDAKLTKSEFIDFMCEAYTRIILGYCKAEKLDPLETLTLFHEKCEEISLKGREEARMELEQEMISN